MTDKEELERLRRVRRELAKQGFAFDGVKFNFNKMLDLSKYMQTEGASKTKKSRREPYSF